MSHEKELRVIEEGPRTHYGISRREAARRLLAGIGAGAALPWNATGHPIWKHLEDAALMERAEGMATEAKLHFLSPEQFESLAAFAEVIVPGSGKAKVAEFVDLLLSVDKEKHQREFVSSLAALESESVKRYGKKFAGISPAQQNELLTYVSTLQKGEQNGSPFRQAFDNVKEWVSGAYYSSEIGMRELGWTPDRVFPEFPGCTHDAKHD